MTRTKSVGSAGRAQMRARGYEPSRSACGIIISMKTKALTPKQVLVVPYPTCGAYENKPCELAAASGAHNRTEHDSGPHPTTAIARK
jgi:hypothetical protein